MDVLRIRGGRPLRGEVQVPGSKNAALAVLSSVVLADEPVLIDNVPNVSDVRIKIRLLSGFGVGVEWRKGSLRIDGRALRPAAPAEEVVRPIRTGFYLMGPLLARVGRADLPIPGGCRIGSRPVDFHLKGLAAMGARISLESGRYVAETDGLVGAEIYLDAPSAGATQHLMATATLAKGATTIHNAAMEPEVVALAQFLNALGGRVEGAGTNKISIVGVERLAGGAFRVPADRLQAGTYLLAGAITGGRVRATGLLPEPQAALVSKLREAGIAVSEGPDWVEVEGGGRARGISVKTMPYPGFPTDMQQPMAALLARADGQSVIEETLYENRIGHVGELNRMGADLRVQGRTTIISGVDRLQGAVVEATDLRAGAALALAGLAAEGETTIRNVHFIDRGYEGFEARLAALGAQIAREDDREREAAPAGRRLAQT